MASGPQVRRPPQRHEDESVHWENAPRRHDRFCARGGRFHARGGIPIFISKYVYLNELFENDAREILYDQFRRAQKAKTKAPEKRGFGAYPLNSQAIG
jgi:hypothetical protein